MRKEERLGRQSSERCREHFKGFRSFPTVNSNGNWPTPRIRLRVFLKCFSGSVFDHTDLANSVQFYVGKNERTKVREISE